MQGLARKFRESVCRRQWRNLNGHRVIVLQSGSANVQSATNIAATEVLFTFSDVSLSELEFSSWAMNMNPITTPLVVALKDGAFFLLHKTE